MLNEETIENGPINEELVVYPNRGLSHFKGAKAFQGGYMSSGFKTVLADSW